MEKLIKSDYKKPAIDEYDEKKKRERIKLYFSPPKEDYKILICRGIISMILIVGIVFAFGIVMYLMGKKRKEIYDSNLVLENEIDKYLSADIEKIKPYILERLNIDTSQLIADPIYSGYYSYSGLKSFYNYYKKLGRDGIYRFTPLKFNAVYLTNEELITFDFYFDFLTGNALNERSNAFYYNDIVSLSTDSETSSIFGIHKDITKESFTLHTSAGTSVTITLTDYSEARSISSTYIPSTDSEKTIAAIRKLLRDRKMMR